MVANRIPSFPGWQISVSRIKSKTRDLAHALIASPRVSYSVRIILLPPTEKPDSKRNDPKNDSTKYFVPSWNSNCRRLLSRASAEGWTLCHVEISWPYRGACQSDALGSTKKNFKAPHRGQAKNEPRELGGWPRVFTRKPRWVSHRIKSGKQEVTSWQPERTLKLLYSARRRSFDILILSASAAFSRN